MDHVVVTHGNSHINCGSSDSNNCTHESISDNNNKVVIYVCDVCRPYLLPSTTTTTTTTTRTSGACNDNDDHDDNDDDIISFDFHGGTVRLIFQHPQPQQHDHDPNVSCRPYCFVCLGLWRPPDDTAKSIRTDTGTTGRNDDTTHDNTFTQHLITSVIEASKPYNNNENDDNNNNTNRYSRFKSIPTAALPGDIIYRFVLIHELLLSSKLGTTTPTPTLSLTQVLQDYITELKQCMKRTIHDCCNTLESTNNNDNNEYPSCIKDEELGYLTFHSIIIPRASMVHRPVEYLRQLNDNHHYNQRTKRTRKERMMKQNSQYTAIHDTTHVDIEQSQGGDPRVNFERRFMAQQQQYSNGRNDTAVLWSIHQAIDQLSNLHQYITNLLQTESNHSNNHQLYDHLKYMSISHQANYQRNDAATTQTSFPLSCYTTVWRRPFYIRGIYTKIYRTISQTPFFVVDDVVVVAVKNENTNHLQHDGATLSGNNTNKKDVVQKRRRRLGTTSVEEVITPYILQATNGVATHNNNYYYSTEGQNNGPSGSGAISGVVYGMAKFHASGREDMNVRMLLPLSYNYNDDMMVLESNRIDQKPTDALDITGRPFVYEIYDAIRLPRMQDLHKMVSSINHIPLSSSLTTTTTTSKNEIRKKRRSYGCNPLGVDISNDISFVPSSSYKRLQEETEHKIKYYECYCWCEQSIDQIIQSHQRTQPLQQYDHSTIDKEAFLNDLLFGHVTFPIKIQQRTPIRVLHRRTNMIRPRYIYSCRIQLMSLDNKDGNDNGIMGSDISSGTNHIHHNSNYDISYGCDDTNRDTKPQYQPHHFVVHLSTSAGTYVKEFIHGDMGRTVPNLSTMFGTNENSDGGGITSGGITTSCRTDILELDCTGIQS
jgi:tRNA U54 and U55 pseudouridine synthase Pus10